jgi:protein-tyrosine phosphatase
MKVLFVCTGNICRSPTAEAVLRKLSAESMVRIHVESCGTHGYHVGDPPDPRTQDHARRRGYNLSAQRARQLADGDFAAFDLILAMDRGHLLFLQQRCPAEHQPKLRLFLGERDVPDPYYGGAEGFEEVLDLVEPACAGLLQELRRAIA